MSKQSGHFCSKRSSHKVAAKPPQARPAGIQEAQQAASFLDHRAALHLLLTQGQQGDCFQSPNYTYATRTCHTSSVSFVLKLAVYLLIPPEYRPMSLKANLVSTYKHYTSDLLQ